jgi:hypothetical protein
MLFVLAACGGSSARPPVSVEPTATAVTTPPADLVVLPVASGRLTRLGAALDRALTEAAVENATPRPSSVSLDVVQLSIECVEQTPSCYGAVARSLEADQLLFARIDQEAAGGPIRVEVLRTDAEGSTLSSADATFATEDEAAAGAEVLVARGVGRGGARP